ncbi:hypothetical protein KIH77_08725 [Bifidobacterium sp. 82T24]|nr:hypothetical protein [Bifidobacterium pluvialisilvae]
MKPTAPDRCSTAHQRGEAHCTQTLKEPLIEPLESHAREKTIKTITEWKPNPDAQQLADECGLDLQREADKFRDRCLAEGKTPKNPDAAFRNWLRRGKELNIACNPNPKPTPTPPRHVEPPHRHSAGCEHVTAIIKPIEHRFSTENTHGFGSSQRSQARQRLADMLNEGVDPQTAVDRLLGRVAPDELDQVA